MAHEVQSQPEDLKHWDWKVRAEAVRRIEFAREAAAVGALVEALGDESQYVRAAAARALGKLGRAEAVPALIRALEDAAFIVRQNAMWSLGEIGAAAREALPALKALADDNTMFHEREITVGELARLVIARIEAAPQPQAEAAEAASAPQPAEGVLSPEERKARREAALARKRAREQGSGGG